MRHAFELVVVRHGQTAWNAGGRFQGQTDVPLSDAGRAQARALGAYLADRHFDVAVTSDLSRARETAELVLGEGGPALEPDARWREMRFGVWEGLTWPEIVAATPEMAGRSPTSPKFYTPSGGESFDDLCARVDAGVSALDARTRDGERVLVATHAGTLHALLRVTLGEREADALGVRFLPASVTRLAIGPGIARVLELGGGPARGDLPAPAGDDRGVT